MYSDISFCSKEDIGYTLFARIGAVLLLSLFLVMSAYSTASAKSIKRMFLGVKDVEVTMRVVADRPVKGLVDEGLLGASVLEQAKSILHTRNPDLPIRLAKPRGIPELKQLDKGTLAIVLTLTVRSTDAGAAEPPCCLGALSMRIDRDLVRRGNNKNLVYTEDRYRMNFPPEPIFLGSDQSVAQSRAEEASVELLQPILSGVFR